MKEEEKLMKVYIPPFGEDLGESVWAKRVSSEDGKSLVEIRNVCMSTQVHLNDIVQVNRVNGRDTFIKVIEQKTRTVYVRYDAIPDFKDIVNYLEARGCSVEGMVKGVASVAVPVGMPATLLIDLMEPCPGKSWFPGSEAEVDWLNSASVTTDEEVTYLRESLQKAVSTESYEFANELKTFVSSMIERAESEEIYELANKLKSLQS